MLNNATIMGRLTRDAVMRKTQTGVSVCSFTVAVDRDTSKDGMKVTDYIDCVAWRQTADFIDKYFHKGSLIVVNGAINVRTWEDKDGNKRKSTEVIAHNVYFGEGKKNANVNGYEEPEEPEEQTFEDLPSEEGDLPF